MSHPTKLAHTTADIIAHSSQTAHLQEARLVHRTAPSLVLSEALAAGPASLARRCLRLLAALHLQPDVGCTRGGGGEEMWNSAPGRNPHYHSSTLPAASPAPCTAPPHLPGIPGRRRRPRCRPRPPRAPRRARQQSPPAPAPPATKQNRVHRGVGGRWWEGKRHRAGERHRHGTPGGAAFLARAPIHPAAYRAANPATPPCTAPRTCLG